MALREDDDRAIRKMPDGELEGDKPVDVAGDHAANLADDRAARLAARQDETPLLGRSARWTGRRRLLSL
jgi:hypothetical protein